MCHESERYYIYASVIFQQRFFGENVRLIFELIEYVNVNYKPGLFFFSDFEKAFDSLNL